MKWALLLLSQSILAGCGQSKPESTLIQPHRVYVEPQPIHHSVIRTRKSSASHSDSDDDVILKHAIFAVTHNFRPRVEEKKDEVRADEPKPRFRRQKTPDPVWDLD